MDKEQQYGSGTARSQKDRRALHRRRLVRRKFLKLGAAGGAAMVASLYVSPSLRSIGAAPAYAGTPVGGEGCTPGFWKNVDSALWPGGYAAGDSFLAVFGVAPGALTGKTLIGALTQGGGCEKALGRHAVAALLNAASVIAFPITEAQVISDVLAALNQYPNCSPILNTKDDLESYNEAGCPLGAKTVAIEDDWYD